MKVYDRLCHIVNTLVGMYQEPFSQEWDDELNSIMSNGVVENTTRLTVDFRYENDIITVWTGNRWYSFGHLHRVNGNFVEDEFRFRPRFKTMVRLHELFSEKRQSQLKNQYREYFKSK